MPKGAEKTPPKTFQDLILTLQRYWAEQGCVLLQPYDMEVGAGTFHTATFLRALGPEPWNAAYVQPSRRPTDGRYGDNPFRLQHYYQFQVVMKPSPDDIIERYFGSLAALGLDPLVHDLRLVEDNWESPTLGAWGLGWEVWLNGMEVTQFTYFQQAGGLDCQPVMGEITYGLERLAMYLQGVDSVYRPGLDRRPAGTRHLRRRLPPERGRAVARSTSSTPTRPRCSPSSSSARRTARRCSRSPLPLPAYEQTLKASHVFNLLDARQAISVTERQRYILRVRALARGVAGAYYASREAQGFPSDVRKRHEPPRFPGRDRRGGNAAEEPRRPRRSLSRRRRRRPRGGGPVARRGPGVLHAAAPGRRSSASSSTASRSSASSGAARRSRRLSTPPASRRARRPLSPCPAGSRWTTSRASPTTRASSCSAGPRGAGEPAAKLLPGIVQAALDTLPIARRMRWGDGKAEFVRPVHWVVMLHGDAVVPGEILGIAAGRMTRGHRFHTKKPIALRSPGGYLAALEKGHVRRRPRGAARAHPGGGRRGRGAEGGDGPHRPGRARRGGRPDGMAGAARGRLRSAFPRAAAGGAGRDDAGSPALLPRARAGRRADAALHRRRQPGEQGPGAGTRRQRARDPPEARRCRFLLRGRPQGDPRQPLRCARRRHLPGPARLARGQGCARHRPGRPDRAARGLRRCDFAARRPARQVRPADRHGRRIPRVAGRDGPLLRPP